MAKTFNNVDVAQEWADNLTFVSDKSLQAQDETNFNTADVPEVVFQESAQYAGVEFDENEKIIGKALYTVNKEAKNIIKPIKIDVDSVPNFDNVKDLKEWIATNLDLIGEISIKDNNRVVLFNKGNIGRSMKGINRSSVKRNSYSGLKELVKMQNTHIQKILITDIQIRF